MLDLDNIGEIDVTKPIPWLWPNYIPAGKVVLVYGDGGLGKSTLGIDLAARVSTDGVMPDGSQGLTGKVLVVSVEDDKAFIAKRLHAAGAAVTGPTSPAVIDVERGFDLSTPGIFRSLEETIVKSGIKLLILDPLEAIAGDINLNRANQVRDRLFTPLGEVMAATGCTAIVMHHTNKTDTPTASNKSSGNKAIVNAARAAYMVVPDLKDKEAALLVQVKSNMGKKMPTLKFEFEQDEEFKVGVIEWTGESLLTKDDLGASDKPSIGAPPRARLEAVQFAREFLAAGPRPAAEFDKAVKDAGIAVMTMKRARPYANVQPLRQGGKWYVHIPGMEAPPAQKKLLKRKPAKEASVTETKKDPLRRTRVITLADGTKRALRTFDKTEVSSNGLWAMWKREHLLTDKQFELIKKYRENQPEPFSKPTNTPDPQPTRAKGVKKALRRSQGTRISQAAFDKALNTNRKA